MKLLILLFVLLLHGLSIAQEAPVLQKAIDLVKNPPSEKQKVKRPKVLDKDKILRIRIRGNKQISEDLIRNEIIVRTGEKPNPIKINLSVKNLQSTGYFSQVRSQVTNGGQGKTLTFYVKENPVLKKLIINGNKAITDKELAAVINSKEGELLDLSLIRKDIKAIEDLYKERGYFLAKVHNVKSPKTSSDPLIFQLSEGVLEEIIISGNVKTKDYVILREMDLSVGEAMKQKVLKKDMQKIFNLNYFSKLNPVFLPGEKKNQHKLKLDLEEKSTGTFNFGGGYGRASGLFMYSDLYLDNLFGTGQLVALKGQWGRSNTYQFKYFNPWMWDGRKSLAFRIWYTTGLAGFSNFSNSGFRSETRQGFDLAIGIPFSYEWRANHKIKNEDIYIPEDVSESTNEQDYSIRSYNFVLSFDSRDFRMNPRDGQFHSFSVEKGFKAKSNSLDFLQWDANMNWFKETRKNQVIAFRFKAGEKLGDITSKESELYYVGGANTVRGYPDFPDSFGRGTKQIVGNLEYRFLFNEVFTALIFLDAGWTNQRQDGTGDISKIGKGFGARIMSPLGPIRLDFGIDEETEMIIHFNIGHVF